MTLPTDLFLPFTIILSCVWFIREDVIIYRKVNRDNDAPD